ncbi:MAG: O-antigen ligase family protein [Candidatus Omnitrophota bacterium]|nr:MAG: O-antigen ligase family protein [Candidatus Omnitrophota bacterium]
MLFAAFCLFFSVINTVDKKAKFERLVIIIVLWAVIIAFYGVMKKFFILEGRRILGFSTFGNKNHYAGYMVMFVPLSIGYALSCQDKYKKLLFVFFGAAIAVSIFISASRGGALSVIFALLLLPFLSFRKHSIRNDILVILAVFIFIVIMAFMGDVGDLHKKFSGAGIFSDGRWRIFRDSLGLVRDFPLFGVGLGNFQYIFTTYDSTPGVFTRHLHNDHFQLVVEAGLIGSLLCFIFFIMVFKDILTQLRKTEDPFVRNVVAGGLSGLFGIILHAGFSFHFHIPASLFMFWLILGLVYKCAHTQFIYEKKKT